MPLVWAINPTCPNHDVVWCAFCVGTELAWLHIDDLHMQQMELISPTLWEHNLENVKATCFDAASSLSCELHVDS